MPERPHFSVLGPLEVIRAGQPVRLGGARQKTLLATLVLRANRTVSITDLADRLWSDKPPADSRRTIQVYIVRLRQALGSPELIQSDPTGYLIRVQPGDLDLLRFDALVHDAAKTPDPNEQAELLSAALGLWRGPACSDVTSDVLHAVDVPPLHDRRLDAEERLIDVELALGRHAAQLPRLRGLVADNPLRERFAGQLMLALYRSGRQADALDVYRSTAATLADELGLDPGPELRDLHQAVLTADSRLLAPVPANKQPVPAQLPADLARFTGRSAELDELLSLPDRSDDAPTAVLISAIDGMAGIGKTALAVHAAHRLAPHFPHGQLFMDLHGYTAGVPPVEPADALDRMLRALGILGSQIPIGLEDRAALYRTTLAGRRMLIVLDNANRDTQIQPLLPGQPGCLVLITSRQRLALDSVHQLTLDVLPVADATALFAHVTGLEPSVDDVTEVVELCGRLPLAIRVAAARLRARPTWPVRHLADRLRGQRLDALETGQTSVAAAFELSYQQLGTDQERAFRLLGVHPGPEIDPSAAAALTNTSVDVATRLLDDLVDTHLLQETVPGRYQFHDLMRAYASSRETSDSERRAALSRLLDHYAFASTAAMDLMYPHESDQRPRPPIATTPELAFDGRTQAETWLDRELPNLVAATHATGDGWPDHAIHQSTTLHHHLRTRADLTTAAALHQRALASARASANSAGELACLTNLGSIYRAQGRTGPATDLLEQALVIARETGHRAGEVDALWGLGNTCYVRGQFGAAGDLLEQALVIARETGYLAGEVNALTGLGRVHHTHGQYHQAGDAFMRALEIARTITHLTGEQMALTGLAWVHRAEGRYEPAIDALRQALVVARAAGHRGGEGNALEGLGLVHGAQGQYGPAAHEFEQALEIARETGYRAGEASALIGLGEVRRAQHLYEPAADAYRQALELARALENRNAEFEVMYGLGRIDQATGDHDKSLVHQQEALTIATELDNPQDEARAHDGLADAHRSLGDHDRAREHWQAALKILQAAGLDHTDDPEVTTDTIRAHLAALDREQATGIPRS